MPFDLASAKPASPGGFNPATARPVAAPAQAPTSKDYQRGRAAPAWEQGLVAGTNGILMGFGDELGGALGAVWDKARNPSSDLQANYIANRDVLRGMEDAQRERSPILTAVAQGAGTIPLAMATGGAGSAAGMAARTSSAVPAVAGLGARTVRAATVGGGYGALGGVGHSTADTVEGVLADAGKSAVTSAALGGVATPVTAGIAAVGRNAAQRLSGTAAVEFAKQKIAEALARDARGTLATGGYTNPLAQIAARFTKLGDEAVLADAGGRNTNQLLDTLATLPGRTKEAVFNVQRQRTAGVGDRMRQAADQALGTQGQRLDTTVQALFTRRQQDSAPLYNQLRQIDVAPSPQLEAIVKAADELGVTKLGREIATARQMPFTLDAAQPSRWNMGDLDHVKQGLDQVLSSRKALNPDGKLTPLGESYQQLKNALIGELDQVTSNPQTGASLYRQARQAFATPSGLIDAARAGRLAIDRDESSILSTMKGMTDIEREAFRIGAYEGLRNKLGTQGGQTNIMNMWKEPSTQEKLQAIFGSPRAYRQFAADVAREATLKRLQSVGVGSQTAARQAGMGDLDMSALSDAGAAVGAAKTGNLLTALGAARNAWNRVAVPQSVRDQMGNLLLSRGNDGAQTLNSLAPLIQSINNRNMLLSNGVGVLGAELGAGLSIPALPAQQLPRQ
jgi:hypothetical protein